MTAEELEERLPPRLWKRFCRLVEQHPGLLGFLVEEPRLDRVDAVHFLETFLAIAEAARANDVLDYLLVMDLTSVTMDLRHIQRMKYLIIERKRQEREEKETYRRYMASSISELSNTTKSGDTKGDTQKPNPEAPKADAPDKPANSAPPPDSKNAKETEAKEQKRPQWVDVKLRSPCDDAQAFIESLPLWEDIERLAVAYEAKRVRILRELEARKTGEVRKNLKRSTNHLLEQRVGA